MGHPTIVVIVTVETGVVIEALSGGQFRAAMFTRPEGILWPTHPSDAENLLRPLFGSEKIAAC